MVRTSDLVFGCSVVRAYHPYIFRESSVTTFKLFKIQSQSLSIDVVLVGRYKLYYADRSRQQMNLLESKQLSLLSKD